MDFDFRSAMENLQPGRNACIEYFEKSVHPLLTSSFPDLNIAFDPRWHCAQVYFGRSRVYEGTYYDGISISVAPDRCGNRSMDHGGSSSFTPRCIEGILLMEGNLQNDCDFSWYSLEGMVDAVKNFNGD